MLSVLMILLAAALPLRGRLPTYYTHGAITPTGASRGSGSSNYGPHTKADRAALLIEVRGGKQRRPPERGRLHADGVVSLPLRTSRGRGV
jgi:hypothetical protein